MKKRTVATYLLVVFLNAFVDLGHKILIQNAIFKLYDGSQQVLLTAIINSFILLPFIVLAGLSGRLSDHFSKPEVMQWSAAVAVLLALAITACYYAGWFVTAFAMTLLLAGQSAVFSPAKYGYIRELFGTTGLTRGNGAQQAVSIIAILLGTLVFSIGFEWRFDPSLTTPEMVIRRMAPLGWLLVGASLLEWQLARQLPRMSRQQTGEAAAAAGSVASVNVLRQPTLRAPAIGLALFWCVSQVLLAVYPAYAKDTLGITNTVIIQAMLTASGVGIVLGSLLAARWSRGQIETALIPLGALSIAFTLAVLPWLPTTFSAAAGMLLIGTAGGWFVVPLNALMQFHASERSLGQVMASNNRVQNVAMLGALVLTALAALLAVTPLVVLLALVVLAALVLLYLLRALPQSLCRWRWWWKHHSWPHVEVVGMECLAGQTRITVGPVHGAGGRDLVQMASPVLLVEAMAARPDLMASCEQGPEGYRVHFCTRKQRFSRVELPECALAPVQH